MVSFFAWYLLVTLLGWLTFPLVWRLFPALSDRGYTLSRALGLLVWGYLFWILASLGIVRNDSAGITLALILLILLVAWVARKYLFPQPVPIKSWVVTNTRLIITVEVLFLLAFAGWAFVRASNPNIETAGGEKTMELAFINAILHSPTFPPHDPWLSGYPISYYYFGYVLTAMLAKLTSTPGAVAHNLMSALVFSLSFLGAYGILYNLLVAWRQSTAPGQVAKPSLSLPFLGPIFLLFISNVAGFLEVLHRLGVGWQSAEAGENFWTKLGRLVRPNLEANNFWTWLDIKHLSSPPVKPYQIIPDRFIWWWQDSRVIQDYDLAGNFTEIIDEFPAFSYLLGDLHPHVLAMPFLLLAIAFCLNLILGGWEGETNFRLYRLPISTFQLVMSSLLLGGLAFLNTWDILPGFALLVGGYVLVRVLKHGWTINRLWDAFALGVPLGLIAFVIYSPFFLGFSSQAGGILPNLEYPTRGAHLWVMFGTLFLPVLVTLFYLCHDRKFRLNWWWGISLGAGIPLLLWSLSWILGLVIQLKMPELAGMYINTQGFFNMGDFFSAVMARRLAFIGGLLTLLAILIPTLGLLAKASLAGDNPASGDVAQESDSTDRTSGNLSVSSSPVDEQQTHSSSRKLLFFILLLVFLAAMLVLAPEFVYLRDLFGKRMNTIFKFYYQAWILWSVVAAFGLAVMLAERRKVWRWISGILLELLLIVGLCFPVFGLWHKTGSFQFPAFQSYLQQARLSGDSMPWRTAVLNTWTLDGARFFRQVYPDDARAADWLGTAPLGVVAEAVGGSYSDFGRISVYSGQPAVVGWIGHEDQWRGTFDEQRQRGESDIPLLYQSDNWEEVSGIINWYNIRYIVVGTLENRVYRVNEEKFIRYLVPVFQSGDVTVYQVP